MKNEIVILDKRHASTFQLKSGKLTVKISLTSERFGGLIMADMEYNRADTQKILDYLEG